MLLIAGCGGDGDGVGVVLHASACIGVGSPFIVANDGQVFAHQSSIDEHVSVNKLKQVRRDEIRILRLFEMTH